MSENTQNPLLKILVVLVILLIVVVGIQAWYLLDIKAQLNTDNSQQNTMAMQENQAAIALAAEKRADNRQQSEEHKPSDSKPLPDKPAENNNTGTPRRSDQQKPADNRYAQNNPYFPGTRPAPQQRPGPAPGYRPPQWPYAPGYHPPRWPDPYTDDFFNAPYDAQTWDPYAEIQRMQREMDRMFNESFRRFDSSPEFQHLFREGMISPKLDVSEDDDKYTIQVNLPGSDESSVDVKLDGQQLTIQGAQNYEQQNRDAQGNIIFRERRSGSFKRSFTLPEPVDEKGMKTDINNGVLTIIIPKLKDPV